MAENKTRPTDASVAQYLAAIGDDLRRADCEALAKIMTSATKQTPTMWGPGIVGFGNLRLRYESGRDVETFLVGFSSRKGDISIYGTGSAPRQVELLARLGKHRMGKGCLYVGKLKDVDLAVLEQLISESANAKAG